MKPEFDSKYSVILMNDDVHTFDYVTMAVSKTCSMARSKAHSAAVQAHSQGKACVASCDRADAKTMCRNLQKHGLTVTMAKDDGGGGGDDDDDKDENAADKIKKGSGVFKDFRKGE
jgi:ATP-dependent Clp protease adapter protein ClpS